MDTPYPDVRKQLMAENTYLLALDGDIDFQPEAVTRLVDLMRKNKGLGAACGRIHPTGSGKAEILKKRNLHSPILILRFYGMVSEI